MAAPTPVRALVHSSTLVTAGVYLLIRFHPLLVNLPYLRRLTLVAILTTLIARVRALFEYDLKKIVALSTLRQLGVIVITLTLNLPILALFHLLTHATFKALLFMCRGKIIHEIGDNQDIRRMGSLTLSLPLTGAFFNLANLALCGFPFIAGFYSKDILVEITLMGGWGFIALLLLGAIVGLSSAYSTRLTILRLLRPSSATPLSYSKEEDPLIKNSYIILGVLALSRGAILSWLILPSPDIISLPPQLKLFALLSTILGTLLSLNPSPEEGKIEKTKYKEIIINIWLLPLFSGALPSKNSLTLGGRVKNLDLGWAELFGGQGGFYYLRARASHLPQGIFNSILFYQLAGGLILIFRVILWVYLVNLNRI